MKARRHHLIEEAKAELDIAYEEVKRAESRLIALERDYGERIGKIERANGAKMPERLARILTDRDAERAAIDIPTAYLVEKATLERFSILTAAFSTVCVQPDPADAARTLESAVFRPGELEKTGKKVKKALKTFAQGLHAYTTEEASSENDRQVRDSWTLIEAALRKFGRLI